MESDQALGMTVNGVDEVRRAVRTQVKGGVDWIKVSASGVAGSRFATAETEDLSADEIVAAVSEARKYGKPVHAHAHSREGVRACVEAGVLSLHSGEFVDEEILVLMREKGIIFSPTVAWLHARCLPGYVLAENPAFVEEAWRAYAAAKISIVKARELGVKMAMGSDASHRFHHVPDGALELEYYQELGWPALEVIKAATKTAAEAINRGDRWARLRPAKLPTSWSSKGLSPRTCGCSATSATSSGCSRRVASWRWHRTAVFSVRNSRPPNGWMNLWAAASPAVARRGGHEGSRSRCSCCR